MKNLFKLGFAASLMAACVFSGCSKNDDEAVLFEEAGRKIQQLEAVIVICETNRKEK